MKRPSLFRLPALLLAVMLLPMAPSGSHAQALVDSKLVSRELATLDSFQREMEAFYRQGVSRDQREVIAASLKLRLPSVKQSLESFVDTLKKQDKWTAEFDKSVESQMAALPNRKAAQALLKYTRASGGFRALLMDAIAKVDDFAKEIDADLAAKPPKRAWLDLKLIPAAHAMSKGAKCTIAAAIGGAGVVGGCWGCAAAAGLWMLSYCF